MLMSANRNIKAFLGSFMGGGRIAVIYLVLWMGFLLADGGSGVDCGWMGCWICV